MRLSSRMMLAAGIGLVAVLSGCTTDDVQTEDEPAADEAPSSVAVQLDCEQQDFPCTWGEVGTEVIEASHFVGVVLSHNMASGLSTAEVAEQLSARTDVAQLDYDEESLRFRLEGGRPVWVTRQDPDLPGTVKSAEPALTLSNTAPSGILTSTQSDPIAGTAGSGKSALFLAPYYWQFEEDDLPTLVDQLAGRTDVNGRRNREYASSEGGRVDFFANWEIVSPDASPEGRAPTILQAADGPVGLESFKGWTRYEFVYVSTHGRALCDRRSFGEDASPYCYSYVAAGKFFDPDAGLAAEYGGTRGVVISYTASDFVDVSPLTGLDCDIQFNADLTGESVDPGCRGAVESSVYARVGLETDFFRDQYPSGLPNTIVFFDACQLMRVGDLADVLIGGNPTTVLGFDRIVTDAFTKPIAARIIEFMVHGVRTDEWEAKLQDVLGDGLVLQRGTDKGGEDAASASSATGSIFDDRGSRLRGRDIVELVDPATGEELEDSSSIRIIGTPGDGSIDRVRVAGQVIGVADDEDPGAFNVQMEVKERSAGPKALPYQAPIGESVHRFGGEVPLGFDAKEGERVDLEITAEIPRGGTTRWLYEDIELVGMPCEYSFQLHGGVTQAMIPEEGDDLQSFTMRPSRVIGIEQENQPNMVTFNLIGATTGEVGTFKASVNGGFGNPGGGIVYGGEVTVTLFENDEDILRGRAQGTVTAAAPPYTSERQATLEADFTIGHNPESTEIADPISPMAAGMVGPIRGCGVRGGR